MPATSQLDWLISTTAMIVLSWSRATRDLLKSFGWGIRALHQLATSDDGAIFLAALPPYHLSAGGEWISNFSVPRQMGNGFSKLCPRPARSAIGAGVSSEQLLASPNYPD